MKRWRTLWPALSIFFGQVVTAGPWRHDLSLKLAQQLLFIRSHWLRMPPYLLIPHLLRKLVRNRAEIDLG